MTPRSDLERHIGRRDLEILEEATSHFRIIMLASMDQHCSDVLLATHLTDQMGDLDEVRSRADDVHDFHEITFHRESGLSSGAYRKWVMSHAGLIDGCQGILHDLTSHLNVSDTYQIS